MPFPPKKKHIGRQNHQLAIHAHKKSPASDADRASIKEKDLLLGFGSLFLFLFSYHFVRNIGWACRVVRELHRELATT